MKKLAVLALSLVMSLGVWGEAHSQPPFAWRDGFRVTGNASWVGFVSAERRCAKVVVTVKGKVVEAKFLVIGGELYGAWESPKSGGGDPEVNVDPSCDPDNPHNG